jgi:hypothetical protein
MKFKNELKKKNCVWAESGPRPMAYWARQPTAAVDHHGLTARLARPSSHSAQPARAQHGARAPRRGHCVAAGWRGRRRPTKRQGAGKLAGTAHVGKGEGAGQGGTGGDTSRRRRDDGVVGSARDDGVPVEGSFGDLRGPHQLHGGEWRG